MNFKNALVKTLVLLTLLFQGCSKKDSGPGKPEEEKPVPLVNKLKALRVNTTSDDGTNFYYNGDGAIEKMETIYGVYTHSIVSYIYKDKLLVSLNAVSAPRFGETPLPSYRQTFKYIGTQIVEALVERLDNIPGVDNSPEVHTFTYDARGFIKSKKKEFIRNGNKVLYLLEKLNTDDRGNVTRLDREFYDKDVHVSTLVELREYDNKVNPLYKLISPTVLDEYFNPNNRTKNTAVNIAPGFSQVDTYEYEYNDAGMAVKLTSKLSTGTFVSFREYYK